MANNYVYTKLNKISSSDLKEFNIYGVITEVDYRISNDLRGNAQGEFRLKLNDGTTEEDIDVTIYCKLEDVRNTVFEKRKIVRFRGLQKNAFRNSFYLYGRVGVNTTTFDVFDFSSNNGASPFKPRSQSKLIYSQSMNEVEMLNALIPKAEEIYKKNKAKCDISSQNTLTTIKSTSASPQPRHTASSNSSVDSNVHQNQQKISQQSSLSEEKDNSEGGGLFKEIYELVAGNSNYYNVLVQVISCYKNSRGNIVLRCWDGTRNIQQPFISRPYDLKLIYGDEKREKLIAAQNKLYDVACYDEHGRDAANFNPGDYVALINVHFYIPRNCFLPSLVMHGGPGIIQSSKSITDASRKVIQVTKEFSRTCYDFIDGNIKEHEKSFSKLDNHEINKCVPSQAKPLTSKTDEIDDGFNDPMDIVMLANSKSSSNKRASVAIQISQCSTTPISSKESKSQNTSTTIRSASISPQSSSSNVHQKHQKITPQTPSGQYSSNKKFDAHSKTNVTVSQSPSNSPAVRRSSSVAFQESQNSDFAPTPSKLSRLAAPMPSITESNQDIGSTQALFDKLKSVNYENDIDLEVALCKEEEMLNAISDNEIDKMWEEAENAKLH